MQINCQNDYERWCKITEIVSSNYSDEELAAHYRVLKSMTEDPLLSVHPKITALKNRLAIIAVAVEEPVAPARAPWQVMLNVHDARLKGQRKIGQDFLDAKHPIKEEKLTPDEFGKVVAEIKKYMADNSDTRVEVLKDYLDFLSEQHKEIYNKDDRKHITPPVQSIMQAWYLCQNNQVVEYNSFLDVLHESATVYKYDEHKFWRDLVPPRDYSCHPGAEERVQIMVAGIAQSLEKSEEKSYASCFSDYVMQSFSLLSSSMDGRETLIVLKAKARQLIYDIAKDLIEQDSAFRPDHIFKEEHYSRPITFHELLTYYDLKEGNFQLKPKSEGSKYQKTIEAEGLSNKPAEKAKWYAINRSSLPEIGGAYIEMTEDGKEFLSHEVLKKLYEQLEMDHWLISAVFTNSQHQEGQDALRIQIVDLLTEETDSLFRGEDLAKE